MRKSLLWILVLMMNITLILTFSITGCKAPVEEVAEVEEEAVAPAEEVAEEETEETVSEEKIEVTFSGWHRQAWQKFVPELERVIAEKYPYIEIVHMDAAYEECDKQYPLMLESGEVPDLSYIDTIMGGTLNSIDGLQDLSKLISQDILDDVVDSGYQACLYEGKLTSLPWFLSQYSLFTNTVLAEKAGYSGPPETIGEFEEMVYAIGSLGTDEDGNKIWGYNLPGLIDIHNAYLFSPWLYNFGGNWFGEDGKSTINSLEAVECLSMFKEMYDAGIFGPTPIDRETNRDVFGQDQVGFITEGSWQRGIWRDKFGEEFDTHWWNAPFPSKTGEPGMSLMYMNSLGILRGAKHPEEAALILTEIISNPELVEFFFDYYGNLPVVKSLLSQDKYQTDPYAKVYGTIAEAGGYTVLAPYAGKTTQLGEMFAVAFQEILLNDLDVQVRLDQLADEMNAIVSE